MKTRTARWTAVAAVVAMGLMMAGGAGPTSAATYTWTGTAGDGLWFTGGNWDQSGNVPGQTTDDQAYIGATVSGTINYNPGTPTTFDYLNIVKASGAQLTVNVNGNLTTAKTGVNNVTDSIGAGGDLIFNVNSGTYAVGANYAPAFKGTQFNVASGATVVAFKDGAQSNRHFVNNKGTMTIKGTLYNYILSTDNVSIGNYLVFGGSGNSIVIDGGTVKVDGLGFGSFNGGDWDGVAHSVIVTNNGSLTTRFGGYIYMGGHYGVGGVQYVDAVTLASGTVKNNSALYVGSDNSQSTSRGGTATVTISGGAWDQGGSAYIGDGRVGVVTNSGGTFSCPSDVYVGSGKTTSASKPNSVPYSGTFTINGGTVNIVNTNAGTYTTTGAGSGNPGGNTHWFYNSAGGWDRTYLGQRLVLTSLSGSGTGLSTGTIYYAADIANWNADHKGSFAMAATPGGAGLTGTAYGGATYRTFGARLLVGNTMTFGDGALVITGTVNLVSGALTVDELVATNGAASIVNFSGGTLSASAMTVSKGSAFTVGNGVSAATLNLMGSNAYSFADGLVLNTNAVLTVGGTNAIGAVALTGDLTLRTGAILDLDFNATTNDWVQVTGTVTLPAVATLRARALDSSVRTPIPVLQATSISGSAAGWTTSTINGRKYRAVVSGNQLALEKIPSGTVVSIR